ncbi:peptidase M20 domain-containing protein 2-like [Stylophora pistillata]|uniref:peptidase M20 domain-containing protein 2-like n=1 Tax=Stylophora pistillata TaxID=50429 RepID=UPI000C03AEFF|nr:peptidase M20 domain-containing protein 2-like [Stylophora pistillata]
MATDLEGNLKQRAKEAIDVHSSDLYDLSKRIWEKPELNFTETYAHEQLTKFMTEHGFRVTPHYTLDTAFRAECGEEGGLTIGLLSEYDALPEVGHACGHNLIAESGVAAALGLKIALESAEQKPLDAAVMAYTSISVLRQQMKPKCPNGEFIPVERSQCTGCSSHGLYEHKRIATADEAQMASSFPWNGVNTLDAAVMAYTSISALRQQMKPEWRVHLIISEGGVKPNIIPDRAQLQCNIRTMNDNDLEVLKEKVKNCFEAAASATGCKVSMEWRTATRYSHLETNNTLAELYQANAESLGVSFPPEAKFSASTDMGNVSHVVPSIHPMYSIGTTAPNHSHAFTTAAATEEAHKNTLIASKALAMTAIDVLCKQDLMDKVRIDFKQPNNGEN